LTVSLDLHNFPAKMAVYQEEKLVVALAIVLMDISETIVRRLSLVRKTMTRGSAKMVVRSLE